MKKAIVLSAVLVLVSSSSFAATAPTYPSQRVCQFKTHGACVQQGTQWVASATPSTPATPSTTPTTPTTTTTNVAPAAPAAAPAPATQSSSGKSSWWSSLSGGNKPSASSDNEATPARAMPKPVDPHVTARGKVYGSQGSCQGETAGNCKATDCSTHVGGVCEGNKGNVVWSYAP